MTAHCANLKTAIPEESPIRKADGKAGPKQDRGNREREEAVWNHTEQAQVFGLGFTIGS
jgi:hypothetical protein